MPRNKVAGRVFDRECDYGAITTGHPHSLLLRRRRFGRDFDRPLQPDYRQHQRLRISICASPNTDTDTNANTNANTNTYSYSYSHPNANTNTNTYCHANSNTDTDTDTDQFIWHHLDCSNPALNPVPNVTLTLTGTMSGSTLSDGSGSYTFSSLPSGGNYTVTPTKTGPDTWLHRH